MPNHYPFHRIDDAYVILQKAGVYKQADVYRRGNRLYAKYGSGYVRLSPHGTSVPSLMVDGWDIPIDFTTHPTSGWILADRKAPQLEEYK